MPEHRLAKRLIDWVKNLKADACADTNWQKNVQEGLKNAIITDTDIEDRDALSIKIRE